MARASDARRRRMRQRTAQLRREIAAMELVATGTVNTRTKVCGKPTCRCAADAAARHGPYHGWFHREDGRLVHTTLNEEQAQRMREAIANYRRVQELLAQWEQETVAEILETIPPPKS